ncbi:endonuclease/exonuclease/phosphatase family protein [Micromonospora sp. SH-82]
MLTVMTWNIRTGGRDADGGTGRLDAVARVVEAHRPDLLALQELRGFERDDQARRFASAIGMRLYPARSLFGQPVAVAVRPPLRVLTVAPLRRPFHHAAQRVTVATTAGPLTVLAAHLDPYSGTRRLVEAGWLAAAVRRAPGEWALLAADLNTLDPDTDHTARVAGLPTAYRRRHLRRDGRTVETRATARLAAAGLVDLYPARNPGDPGQTVPTTAGGGAEFTGGMRLDYLYATASLARLATTVTVLRGGDTEWASDHYPLRTTLTLHP